MIAQLTGTVVEVGASLLVLDVGGVGYELGISLNTAGEIPPAGTPGVRVFTRLVVREDAMELYGFHSREERALFDRLVAVTGVGPKLALATLSTFRPQELATIVATSDANRMAQVPGVGKRKAQRLLVELEGVFQKDAELRSLVGLMEPLPAIAGPGASPASSVMDEAQAALLSMGFTPQEVTVALEGLEGDSTAASIESVLGQALRRLGGGA